MMTQDGASCHPRAFYDGRQQRSFTINTLGQLALFQAVMMLLERIEKPRWVIITSAAGSTRGMEQALVIKEERADFIAGLVSPLGIFTNKQIKATDTQKNDNSLVRSPRKVLRCYSLGSAR